MTAPVNAWTAIAAGAIDPDSPVDSALITALRNNQLRIREMLCGSYAAGEAIDHNHDGVNSALVQIGPNYLRNGSFESGVSGWTVTTYAGGTVAAQAAGNMDGSNCIAITSTVLANGGGDLVSTDYTSITEGAGANVIAALKASAGGGSSKIEVIWYDNAKSQISATTVYYSINTPTALTQIEGCPAAPVNARFFRIKITGGVPGAGTATGVIYFDGLITSIRMGAIAGNYLTQVKMPDVVSAVCSTAPMLVMECRVGRGGTYRTIIKYVHTGANYPSAGYHIALYRNGGLVTDNVVAYNYGGIGVVSTLYFMADTSGWSAGDLLQVYFWDDRYEANVATTFGLLVLEGAPMDTAALYSKYYTPGAW